MISAAGLWAGRPGQPAALGNTPLSRGGSRSPHATLAARVLWPVHSACPARSNDSPLALTPQAGEALPGILTLWASILPNENSAFSSTFQTVECKHQVFPRVRLLWVLHSDPFSPSFPPAPSTCTPVPTWAFSVGVGVPGKARPVACCSCPAVAS